MTFIPGFEHTSAEMLLSSHVRLCVLTDVVHGEVLPSVDAAPKSTVLDAAVQGSLIRALAWGLSLKKLEEVYDFQAQSAGCRALLEIVVDLALLTGGAQPAEKLKAWEDCCKFSEAEKALASGPGQPQGVDAAQRVHIKRNRTDHDKALKKYWPGKTVQPMRWTGNGLAKDARAVDKLPHVPSMKLGTLMRDHYARLNWAIHGSGVLLARSLGPTTFPGVSIFAVGLSFDLLANVVRLSLTHFGLFDKRWEERIYMAKTSGPVEMYRRKLEAIATKAEQTP